MTRQGPRAAARVLHWLWGASEGEASQGLHGLQCILKCCAVGGGAFGFDLLRPDSRVHWTISRHCDPP
eukprot:scaffold316991_cov25-Prasinocladus_malaysianus.AAC.2